MKNTYLKNRPSFQCETHPSNERHYVNGCCKSSWCSANLTLDTSKMFEKGENILFGNLDIVFCRFVFSLLYFYTSSPLHSFAFNIPLPENKLELVFTARSCMTPWLPDYWMCHEHPSSRMISSCCNHHSFCTENIDNLSGAFHKTYSFYSPFDTSDISGGGAFMKGRQLWYF